MGAVNLHFVVLLAMRAPPGGLSTRATGPELLEILALKMRPDRLQIVHEHPIGYAAHPRRKRKYKVSTCNASIVIAQVNVIREIDPFAGAVEGYATAVHPQALIERCESWEMEIR